MIQAAIVPPLFGINNEKSKESQGYSFVLCTEVGTPMDMVGEMLGCVFLRWSANEAENLGLRRAVGTLEKMYVW